MNAIKTFLSTNLELGYAIMVVVVFAVTFLFGLLVKHFTQKITDGTKRKACNSILFFIAVAIGFLMEYIYSVLAGVAFKANYGIILGACGIGTNEGIKILKYYIQLLITKISNGEKITAEELLKPLPTAELEDEQKIEITEGSDKKKDEKVVKEKEVVDPVKEAQSKLDKLLKS